MTPPPIIISRKMIGRYTTMKVTTKDDIQMMAPMIQRLIPILVFNIASLKEWAKCVIDRLARMAHRAKVNHKRSGIATGFLLDNNY